MRSGHQRAGYFYILAAMLCAAAWTQALAQSAPEIPRFSGGKPDTPPTGWVHSQLASFKASTEYSLANADGQVVLRAVAHNSASLLAARTDFDPHRYPMLSWRWKIVHNVAGADTHDRKREDAAARVMVSFAGDTRKLSLRDRAAASAAEAVSGLALPYAELMYISGSKVPLDSLTTSAHTSRIRMFAVAADDDGVGQWQSYSRNLVDDFKRAFGEEPGNVIAVKVMTDTDNTGSDAETLFGDIRVQAP